MALPFTHLSECDVRALQHIAGSLPREAVCAEVGSYLGASAVLIAEALPTGAKLHCIDTWMNDAMSEGRRDTFKEFCENTADYADRIVPLRTDSVSAAEGFTGKLDFLFIDGDHSYEGCRADILAWLPKMKPGGIVAFHDIGWAEGVQRAVRESFLPAQLGEGVLLPNFYWARVGTPKRTAKAKSAQKLHPAVISRSAAPSAAQIARLKPGLGDMDWSWIAAGSQRSAQPIDGSPALHDAGSVGLLAGRQKAIQVAADAGAEVLILLDDDVSLPTGWAEKMLAPFADPDVHFVGCRYLPDYAQTPPAWMEGLWWASDDGFRTLGHLSLLDGGENPRFYTPMLVWGLCFAARVDTLQKLGGFNPDGYPWELRRFRGDGENGLSAKAQLLGLKAFYQGETHVLHHVPAERMTPQYFQRRSFLQGISESYTSIRCTGVASPAAKASWKDALRPAKWRIEELSAYRSPTTARIRRLMGRAYMQGLAYHQAQVRSDPALLEWVTRPLYGHGSLPTGACPD